MNPTDIITQELLTYHIRSLKIFSLLTVIGSLIFSLCSVYFLGVGNELLLIFIPFVIFVSINTQFITKMRNGGKRGYFVMSLLSFGAIFSVAWFTGGIYSSFNFVNALLLASAFLFNKKLGYFWSVLISIGLIFLFGLKQLGWTASSIIPDGQYHNFQLFSLLFLLYLIGILTAFFNQAGVKARNSRNIIREQNQIIRWKNKQMMDNVGYAGKIQRSMFVKRSYLENIFKAHTLFYKPKDQVGGDFYWVNQCKNGNIVWAVGDCTGHGVSGALMTMIGVSLLNDIVRVAENNTNPKEILDALHEGFLRDLSQDSAKSGMNIGVCILDLKSLNLKFSGAKMPLHIIREGNLIIIDGIVKSVGFNFEKANDYEFRCEDFQLQSGDKIYMFSDGFSDQFGGPERKKFYMQNFHDLLVQVSPKSMREQEEILEDTFNRWNVYNDQVDDVLVMGVEV